MTFNFVYVGAALVAVGLIIAVLSINFAGGEPRGVAKSLMLIENSVDRRTVVTTELAAKDRLIAPVLDRTKNLARALSPSGTDERYTMMLDQAGNPSGWTVERILGLKGVAL